MPSKYKDSLVDGLLGALLGTLLSMQIFDSMYGKSEINCGHHTICSTFQERGFSVRRAEFAKYDIKTIEYHRRTRTQRELLIHLKSSNVPISIEFYKIEDEILEKAVAAFLASGDIQLSEDRRFWALYLWFILIPFGYALAVEIVEARTKEIR